MAKSEQVLIARQGSQAIARWREQNPGERLDFSHAILTNHNLNQADLSEADLSGADLIGAFLNQANLRRANLRESNLIMGHFHGANLREADLSSANLRRAYLGEADLSNANLSGANLSGANLSKAILENAALAGANLSEANLRGANFSGADASRAEFNKADLGEANLAGANLGKATFFRSSLAETAFEGAIMFHTVFGDCDLSRAVGLDRVQHEGPSTVGIESIFRSSGLIPEAFLRGAGVPEDSINYQGTVAKSPHRYYTCFISCCNDDLAFAERLQADLESRGVRCWCFPADSRGGRWIGEDVDRGIHFYDKLIVVCSDDSLNAERVRDEITHGMQKQEETGRWLFFPVGTSDAAYDRRHKHVNSLRLWRHIVLDFRGWEDSQTYNAALDGLIGHLNKDQDASVGMAPVEEE